VGEHRGASPLRWHSILAFVGNAASTLAGTMTFDLLRAVDVDKCARSTAGKMKSVTRCFRIDGVCRSIPARHG
jgi:hypothetical protein